MMRRFLKASVWIVASAVAVGTAGCLPNQRPATAGLLAEKRTQVVKPGKFKADFSGPADGRRD